MIRESENVSVILCRQDIRMFSQRRFQFVKSPVDGRNLAPPGMFKKLVNNGDELYTVTYLSTG